MTGNLATEAVHVAPSGDLRVHIKRGHEVTPLKTFVVSSEALRLASSVWRTMLDPRGPFTKSCGGEMSLTDDDPTALLILMRVAHMQFNQLEAAISYETLLALAKSCDKYDTVTLIRPWFNRWLKPYESQAVEKSYSGFEGLAFVAWTFGESALFGNVAHHLVADMTFDTRGNLRNQGRLVDSTMPPGLAETIKSFRDEKINDIINLCVPQFNQYIALVGTRRSRCTCEEAYQVGEERACDSLNLGNLLLQLTGLGLWPDQETAKNIKSLNFLMSGLLAIPEWPLDDAHENCGFYHSLKSDVTRIADLRLPTDRLQEFEEHMALQKAK